MLFKTKYVLCIKEAKPKPLNLKMNYVVTVLKLYKVKFKTFKALRVFMIYTFIQ